MLKGSGKIFSRSLGFARDLENKIFQITSSFVDHLTNPARAVQAEYYRSKIFSTAPCNICRLSVG